MKNHWIKVNEDRKKQWWSAEFLSAGSYVLRSRRVWIQSDVLGADSDVRTEFGIVVTFSPTDNELMNFIYQVQQSMLGIHCRIRLMQGIYPFAFEIENYELTKLTYDNIFPAGKSTLMNFVFHFEHMRYAKIIK